MALNRVPIWSPSYSSRSGSTVRLVVVHTAQGARTFRDLGAFFQNPANQVSSHVGIDDTPGAVGEYVGRPSSAWTAANANPVAIQAELCAFAEWTPGQWSQHPTMLSNCAQWIAEECAFYGLPVRLLSAGEAQGSGRGVCGHDALGSWGGNHWDPGPSFPWGQVLAMASGGAQPIPEPPKQEEEIVAVMTHNTRNNRWVFQVNKGGQLYRKICPKSANPGQPQSWNNALVSALVWGGNTDAKVFPGLWVEGDDNSVQVYVEMQPSTVVRRYDFQDSPGKPGATDLP